MEKARGGGRVGAVPPIVGASEGKEEAIRNCHRPKTRKRPTFQDMASGS